MWPRPRPANQAFRQSVIIRLVRRFTADQARGELWPAAAPLSYFAIADNWTICPLHFCPFPNSNIRAEMASLDQRDSDGSGRHSCKCNYADTVWVCPAPMLTQFECARRLCLHCSLSLSEPGPYADTVCVKPGPPCWHKFKVETMKQSKISSFSNKTVTMGYEQRQPTFPPTQI